YETKRRSSDTQIHIPESRKSMNFKEKLKHSQLVPELLTLANQLTFTGPFPEPENDDGSQLYKGPTPKSKSYEHLSDFVQFASSKVDIRNTYTLTMLNEHTFYVENFVQNFCLSFGELDELFKSKNIIRCGSSYELAKILAPDEYDYIPVLIWSDDVTVRVENVGNDCELTGQGYGDIFIEKGDLHDALHSDIMPDKSDILDLIKSQRGPSKLNTFFAVTLQTRIYSYLNKIEDYKFFIGERNHKEDPDSPYPMGSLSIHIITHGTSIWLRLGAPLCTVDIDLSFAIEKRDQTQGRCVMVRADNISERCDNFSHWTESLIDQGLKTEQIIHVLSIQ
ncbi:unnamed protein product, partial [Owenia fusiformis]